MMVGGSNGPSEEPDPRNRLHVEFYHRRQTAPMPSRSVGSRIDHPFERRDGSQAARGRTRPIQTTLCIISSTASNEREALVAIIRPVSDLQRKLGEVTRLAKESGEPVYLTKNGAEHLVLMDASAFELLLKRSTQTKGDRC